MKFALNVHTTIVGDKLNNVYLVGGEEAAAFFDSGFDVDEHVNSLLNLWENAGKPDVAAIVVSHRHGDHSGGAAKLAGATGATIISSPVEKESIEEATPGTEVGRTVADGETLDLGGATLQFVHTPGHTVGSLSAYYREERVLFAGDTIRTSEPFKYDPNAGDLGLHLESLRKLLGYDIRLIGPGHGPQVDEPRAFIENEIRILGPDEGQ